MRKGLVYKDRWGRYVAICPVCQYHKIVHPALGKSIEDGRDLYFSIVHTNDLDDQHQILWNGDANLARERKIYPDGEWFQLKLSTPLDLITERINNG